MHAVFLIQSCILQINVEIIDYTRTEYLTQKKKKKKKKVSLYLGRALVRMKFLQNFPGAEIVRIFAIRTVGIICNIQHAC
jgi:hypothetical protein